MLEQQKLAHAIRFLSVDAIQQANSGHPGMPLGMADIATVLWRDFLKHNPQNPTWLNRDRFILSNGHGSMLLYALLHLTGYALSIDDLKKFRKLHSKTPGHPEFGQTPGVETSTGPLGQGLANGVGMALAEKILGAQFNRPSLSIIDHYTYVFIGDGCLMEGISHEAASLAGTHGLGKLVVFWDNNGISIDGNTTGWFTEDIVKRFQAYKWHVIADVNGHNSDAIKQAIVNAHQVTDKPTLICCKTTIGFGAPRLNNTHACHGAPLGDKEITAMRKALDWSYPPFVVPEEIYAAWNAEEAGKQQENNWQQLFTQYQKQYPSLAQELQRRLHGDLPTTWQEITMDYLKQLFTTTESLASRQSSQKILNHYAPYLPELLGGSADLTGSNLTNWSNSKDITSHDATGNYIHYGVREFGMLALMNGMALYGGFIPYGGTFLVFAHYGQNAIRMAALMQQQVIYVFTHDSIGVGEDGPTHQPVEHLAMLRATPNLMVWRPCDILETAIAWQYAIEHRTGPTALILSRQKLVNATRKEDLKTTIANIKRGGYILSDTDGTPDWIIIATGSEVELACKVAARLEKQGKKIRVVSMPSQEVFAMQDATYQEAVLPSTIRKRVAIEAASSQSWHKYVGREGKIIGLDCYGLSAPGEDLFAYFEFTEDAIIKVITTES